MQFDDERAPPTREAVHHGELPEWPGSLEWIVDDQRGEVEQLADRTRFGERDPAHVVVDVEIRIVDPSGSAECPPSCRAPSTKSWNCNGCSLESLTEQRKLMDDRGW